MATCFREDVKQAAHTRNKLPSSHLPYCVCILILSGKGKENKQKMNLMTIRATTVAPNELLPSVLMWDVYVVFMFEIILII